MEGGHKIAALMLRTPELAISSDESKRLALSIKNLAQFYNISPNPQTVAWFQLITIGASIYGPRLAVIGMRKAKARKEKETVQTLTNPPAPQAPSVSDLNNPQGVYKYN